MNKKIFGVLAFILVLLTFVVAVEAVTINSVVLNDTDVFYSNFTGNNIVHLLINVTGANTTAGNNVTVRADFSNLSVNCSGAGTSIINLTNSSSNTDIWNATCDVGDEAAVSNFLGGAIVITANESYGAPSVSSKVIVLYNMTTLSGTPGNCTQWGSSTTNFSQVLNFSSVNFVVHILGNISCLSQGVVNSSAYTDVMILNLTSVDLSNQTNALKLAQLPNYLNVTIAPPKTFGNSRIYIDSVDFASLNTNATIKFFNLPFTTNPAILGDNPSELNTSSISWTSNGFSSAMGVKTGNLTFNVTGFSGYNVTDNVTPTIVLTSLSNGTVINSSTVVINVTLNGTGTELSQASFYANNVLIGNLSNCTQVVNTSELYNCSLTLNNQAEGNYNLTITATDYGPGSGNTATNNSVYTLQLGAPSLVLTSPINNTAYNNTAGSMLKLNFNATDGNGISSCYYNLTGPINQTSIPITGCTGSMSIQLYLMNGTYTLALYTNDTLGKYNSTTANFSVNDTTAPGMTDNTATPSSTSATLSVTTDENATCRYDTGDVTFDSMVNATMVDNLTSHTSTSTVSLSTAGKTYDFYVRCIDMSNNSDSSSLHIALSYGTADTGSSGSSSSDSSGGGGGSSSYVPSVDTTPKPFDYSKPLIVGTNPIDVSYYNGLPIKTVALITNSVSSGDIIMTVTTSPSATYSEKVYKYIQVDHAALDDSSIDSAKIRFRIEKTWLTDNNKTASDIVLLRYKNATWSVLNTSIIDNDTDYVNYLADSPGLSLFAISTKAAPIVTAAVTTTANNNITNGTVVVIHNANVSLKPGDVITQSIDGVNYTLRIIEFSTNGTTATISVNGINDTVSQGQSKVVAGLKLYAQTMTPSSNTTTGLVVLQLGDSVVLQKKPYNWTWTIIIIVLVIIILLFALVQRNERRSPPAIFPEERTPLGKVKRLFKKR